ncbi:MAG: hypothetical protein A2751_03735 [Candidatus Doudnabacteria bacterium RIFCSPHIGHO2_01_FULL_46_14]|uniref:Phosphatidic acid phosphatase type 2/haloperoxidase domain-containing protein n=1 Tax=Candidatus Doudnabacteria bacterium RIFCSPHIGHO2_01_FULL_46_14 TaxID=1817824 RepID=A0A1F5NLH1_9BACT|nr:MAG: hypothetical protein A2751_03735 [Candidatus Doudnabacteria bacterium RIFCSPHIGHO2_01_FULL_46_14]
MRNFDLQVFEYINGLALKYPLWDKVVIYANEYGLYVFAGIVAILFFVNRRAFWGAAISSILARGIITEIIRYAYKRPRPFVNDQLENVRQLVVKSVINDSFPSGHAAFYFAIAFAVYFQNRKAGAVLIILAVILGTTRIYTGIHYPSDILGGALIGFASAWVAGKLLFRR